MATPDEEILQRLTRVRAEVDAAASAAGRDPSEVRLLLATKTQPPDRIITALRAGITLIGENRVQEVVAKADELADVPHELHFIGHLQTNKINQLLGRISCLQTLDSVDLAEKLQHRLETREAQLDVLIQVNVSGEQSKSGIAPDAGPGLVVELERFPALDSPRFHDGRAEFVGSGRGPIRLPTPRTVAGHRAAAGITGC